MNDQIYSRPDRRLGLAEAPRAMSEIASLLPTAPFLLQAPRGERHPVLVMPGFGGSDRSTAVLRGYVSMLGYDAHPWELGRNLGPAMPDLAARLMVALEERFEAGGRRKVSLVGWSLGGVYARIMAHRHPEMVRQVITLGSPFAGNPRSTSAYPIARRVVGATLDQPTTQRLRRMAGDPLPGVPSTAVYSRTDGVVPWRIATQAPSAIAENIEVYGSHVGLGFNPTVLYAVADRLAQRESAWRPFSRWGWKFFAYGPADLSDGGGIASGIKATPAAAR